MYTRIPYIPMVGLLVLALVLGGVTMRPVAANDTTNSLAGLAVGALIYSALDSNDNDNNRHYNYGGDFRTPPTHPRYDPPSRHDRHNYWERPKDTYDRGYSDGWRDGNDYGRNTGRREGYERGYNYGYGDGRHDQRVADNVGRPYNRQPRYADKSYGRNW